MRLCLIFPLLRAVAFAVHRKARKQPAAVGIRAAEDDAIPVTAVRGSWFANQQPTTSNYEPFWKPKTAQS